MKRKASMDGAQDLAAPVTGLEPAGTLDVAVLAGTLVEHRADAGTVELRLFGRLDRDAARLLRAGPLADLPATAQLDLTNLDAVEPDALADLIDHQREEFSAGRQLLLRIAPSQTSELPL